MAEKWVIDAAHPSGHFVPLTPEEEAQRVLDTQAGEADRAARDTDTAADKANCDRLAALLSTLETADTNWPTLTAAQKDAALRQTVRATAGLARLLLKRLGAL